MHSDLLPDLVPDVRPQDDLWGHVNADWVERTEIPSDRSRYGLTDMMRDRVQLRLRRLLESSASAPGSETECLLGALWAAFLAEERIESLGTTPLTDDLALVDSVDDVAGLVRCVGTLQRCGVPGFLDHYVAPDNDDPDRCGLRFTQAGLTLPDESFHTDERHAAIRTAYAEHLERMFTLVGSPDPAGEAAAVFDLEERLAGHHWDRVRARDDALADNHFSRDGLDELAPLPWNEFLDGLRVPGAESLTVQVRQPSFVSGVAALLADRPLEQWRSWLRWRVLHARADLLAHDIATEHFDFSVTTLTGQPEQPPRWKRAVTLVDRLLGEELGHLYVAAHLSPASVSTMRVMEAGLRKVFAEALSAAAWLSPATSAAAIRKLDALVVKVGGPDSPRNLERLVIDTDDLVGSVRRIHAFNHDHEMSRLHRPVDRSDWVVPAHTVNAFYMPLRNEVYFPAGILQPPYLDPKADEAANFGAIGTILGHEMGHAFDDQGSGRDDRGALRDWWTESDRSAFHARTDRLVAQYDDLSPRDLGDEFTVDGHLTLGENIGDLIGVDLAHRAWRERLPVPPTPDEERRFFVAHALRWRGMDRRQTAIRRLTTDPHPPVEFRVGIVRNLAAFHETFGVRAGDDMWLDPEQRVTIF